MLIVLSGLAAGAAHVVSGPDHLAAVAPLAAQDPRAGASLGLQWGLGHGLGAVALGGLGLAARGTFDLHALSAGAEFIVGFALVAVGLWALYRSRRVVVHAHEHDHSHDSDSHDSHSHVHVHDGEQPHEAAAHSTHSHAVMAVGALHGAAGTGHLLAVVPSLALPTSQAVIYLGAYFLAAVLSMTLFGGLLGRVVGVGSPDRIRWVVQGSSTLAVLIGVFWVHQAWPA